MLLLFHVVSINTGMNPNCDHDLWGLQKTKQNKKTVKFSEIRLSYDIEIKVQTLEVFLLLMLLFLCF